MPLSNILTDCAQKLGTSLADAASRTWLVGQVNQAVRELYESTDLDGSLREQVFSTDIAEQQATFPHYVGSVRAIRRYSSGYPVSLVDMAPRYFRDDWSSSHFYKFRVKSVSPIATYLKHAAPLSITIPEAVSSDISVTFVGATQNRSSARETITIPAGSVLATGTTPFSPLGLNPMALSAVIKGVTDVDVSVLDVENRLLATIPSNVRESRYITVQLFDGTYQLASTSNLIEVCYKEHLVDLVEDTDCLPVDGYDAAVVWRVLENNTLDSDLVRGYRLKCQDILMNRAASLSAGVEAEIQVGRSRSATLPHETYDHSC